MQPLGRKPSRFPNKTDCHPRKPLVNWWEVMPNDEDKRGDRRRTKNELKKVYIGVGTNYILKAD